MKKIYQGFVFWGLFLIVVIILFIGTSRNNPASAAFAGDHWLMDFEKAKALAQAQDKDLLINFAGSDWCYWCQRLEREVFSKPAFVQAAGGRFVFVLVDFPQDKSQQSAELQQQNERLAQRFGVKAFPTVVLADAGGRPYAQTGYREGGAQAYLQHLTVLQERAAP